MSAKLADYVMIIDDALPENLSRDLINAYSESNEWRPYADNRFGRGSTIVISNTQSLADNPQRERIHASLSSCFSAAVARYHAQFVDSETGNNHLMLTKNTGFRLLRYQPNESMYNHVDRHPELLKHHAGWPLVSCTINLNNDYEGGRLVLLNGEITVHPAVGQAVLFPSNFLYPHKITTVSHGTRYAVVTWLF